MTGGRKNEQFDIVSQAQRIVDEYERKYFSYLGDTLFYDKKDKRGCTDSRGRRGGLAFSVMMTIALIFAVVWRIAF